jgi:hypothetical protein
MGNETWTPTETEPIPSFLIAIWVVIVGSALFLMIMVGAVAYFLGCPSSNDDD